MSKVYVITSGSCSDYSVLAVCSTEEKAKKTVESLINDCTYSDINDLEIYELDEIVNRIDRGESVYKVTWDNDFENVKIYNLGESENAYDIICRGWIDCGYGYCTSVIAKDDVRAKKVALERFIKWNANGRPN